MNFLDVIILIPIAFGAFKGYQKGLLMEIITLVAFVLATVLAFKLLEQAMLVLTPYIGANENILPLLSFIIVFVLVMVLVLMVGKAAKAFMDVILLGTFDNLAGAIVGALKWAFGFSVILWLMESAGLSFPQETVNQSIIFPYFVLYGPLLIEWMSMLIPYAKELVTAIKNLIHIKPA
jgi:membrane protein required for colicin V production